MPRAGGDVQLRISIVGTDQTQLESLDDWLRREHELVGRITFAASNPQEGELGVLGEALVVAVSSGGTVSVLAASLKAWISLPRHSDVRIRVQGSDGRVVEIAADHVSGERVDDLVRQALASGAPEE
jgi:hypothetical protein